MVSATYLTTAAGCQVGETICRAQCCAAETTQPKPIYFKTGFEHNYPAPAKKRARGPSREWESGSARARQSQAHEQDYGKEPANKAKPDGSQGPESGKTDSDESQSESDAEIHDVLKERTARHG